MFEDKPEKMLTLSVSTHSHGSPPLSETYVSTDEVKECVRDTNEVGKYLMIAENDRLLPCRQRESERERMREREQV